MRKGKGWKETNPSFYCRNSTVNKAVLWCEVGESPTLRVCVVRDVRRNVREICVSSNHQAWHVLGGSHSLVSIHNFIPVLGGNVQ